MQTVRGPVTSSWAQEDGELQLDVEIPPGAEAEVRVPTTDAATVTVHGEPVSEAAGVELIEEGDSYALHETASGTYSFTSGMLVGT